jgi:hypothetical protein
MRRGFGASIRSLAMAVSRARKNSSACLKDELAHSVQSTCSMTRSMWMLTLPLLAASAGVVGAAGVLAEDRVLLQEIMPELAGTPLGALDVAPAPMLGATLVVRKSDVQRALLQAGVHDNSLHIPRSVRVTRQVSNVPREELADQAHEALSLATAPCELRDARFPAEVRLSAGPREFHAEFSNGLRDGSVTGTVVIDSGGQSARVPVVVHLVCPPPDVKAGSQVTARAVVGQVTASAPAEARQPGRVGEVIRITSRATGASLRARVLDAHTVEVVP